MKVGSLFSGMLGLDLAVERSGHTADLAWCCEIEPLPRRLIRRRRPAARLYGDVRGLRPLHCDIITGGFPCNDISVAGKQAGLEGEKSGLWREMHAVIDRVRPSRVLIENVRNLRTLGLREVLTDLARIGYAAEWQTVQALAAGAYHKRSRIFIVAYPDTPTAPLLLGENLRDSYAAAFAHNRATFWQAFPCSPIICSGDLPTDVRSARLTATGNAVCPQQAEPICRAMLAAGEPWGTQTPHEQPELPFAGALRGGAVYVRPVAVPEALAMEWHRLWCEAHPDIARSVLPSTGSTWPTPCTTDAASAARHTTTAEAIHGGTTLTDAARLWATPAAANWRSGSVGDACFDGNSRPLQEQVLRDVMGPNGGGGRFLNPDWVAWLMGFPAGWFLGTSDHDQQIGLFA